jgi:hypothetical protein
LGGQAKVWNVTLGRDVERVGLGFGVDLLEHPSETNIYIRTLSSTIITPDEFI